MQRFTDLRVWREAFDLSFDVFQALENGSKVHGFGVREQLRRAVLSIGLNIAEGSHRETRREYARYLNIAQGSAAETEHLLMLCGRLGVVTAEQTTDFLARVDRIARMLDALRSRVLEKLSA